MSGAVATPTLDPDPPPLTITLDILHVSYKHVAFVQAADVQVDEILFSEHFLTLLSHQRRERDDVMLRQRLVLPAPRAVVKPEPDVSAGLE